MTIPDLIVFAEDWGTHPSSTQHLVSRLAADRRVLWINSIGLRRPTGIRDVRRAAAKTAAALGLSAIKVAAPNTRDGSNAAALPRGLMVISPLAISWPGSTIASCFNRYTISRQIRARLKSHRMVNPVLWASLPTALPIVRAFERSAVFYYCCDDFSSLSGVDHGPVLRMEKALTARANLVCATSERLMQKFPREKTVLVPHGVDFDLFSKAKPRAADLPSGRPVAGFYGTIAPWLDIKMLVSAATELTDWNFVFIGPIVTDVAELQQLRNTYFLGRRTHRDLASYVQHWNVSLIPFSQSPQIDACNPLKLREYLAAGTPIASTPFPALEPYRSLVEVAERPAEFGAAIRRAALDGTRNGARRLRVVAESWDVRAAEIARYLEALSVHAPKVAPS